jgi:hypothetical protein
LFNPLHPSPSYTPSSFTPWHLPSTSTPSDASFPHSASRRAPCRSLRLEGSNGRGTRVDFYGRGGKSRRKGVGSLRLRQPCKMPSRRKGWWHREHEEFFFLHGSDWTWRRKKRKVEFKNL